MASVLRKICSPPIQRHLALAGNRLLQTTSAARFASSEDAETKPKPLDESNRKLLVSDTCIKRLREICQDGSFLRITVEGGGCSGFQYKFDLDNKMNEDDLEFGEDTAKVVIDEVSLEYCSGGTIDYHTELIRAGFRMLANPKAEKGCSCGSSFAVKLD